MNKYMLMAHDQEALKKLGSIVASNKKVPFEEILENYEKYLVKAFEKAPTTKTIITTAKSIHLYSAISAVDAPNTFDAIVNLLVKASKSSKSTKVSKSLKSAIRRKIKIGLPIFLS